MLIPPKLSLYIHFPWCVRKCPYCDFNSHALKQPLDEKAYLAALQRDLEQDVADVWGRPVNTVFMGGGTPSLFSAESMQSLLQHIRAILPLRPAAEVTMEVNPGSQEFDHFGGYLDAGINRLSFGIQSLDDQQLQQLGRIHDSQQAEQAVRLAKQAGFDNFNLDLMFGLPGQTMQGAKADLLRLLDWEPTHVSYYQLTIEANTLFAVQTPENLPDVDLQHDMYLQGREILADHGYDQYEVSAYAQAGRQSEHNLNYWQFGDYLGIGAGAHSKITLGHSGQIRRQAKQKHPSTYQQQVGHAKRIVEERLLDKSTLPFEFLLNQLRLKAPFTWDKYQAVTGLDPQTMQQIFKDEVPDSWFVMDDQQLQLTDAGFLMSDEILQKFI